MIDFNIYHKEMESVDWDDAEIFHSYDITKTQNPPLSKGWSEDFRVWFALCTRRLLVISKAMD